MEADLSKACWRAGMKLVAGLAVIGAAIGIRIVTVAPAGIEGEIAELERFEAQVAATAPASARPSLSGDGVAPAPGRDGSTPAASRAFVAADAGDLDRMVRCALGSNLQFMRASDCETRGGRLEELPPVEPEGGAIRPGH